MPAFAIEAADLKAIVSPDRGGALLDLLTTQASIFARASHDGSAVDSASMAAAVAVDGQFHALHMTVADRSPISCRLIARPMPSVGVLVGYQIDPAGLTVDVGVACLDQPSRTVTIELNMRVPQWTPTGYGPMTLDRRSDGTHGVAIQWPGRDIGLAIRTATASSFRFEDDGLQGFKAMSWTWMGTGDQAVRLRVDAETMGDKS